MSIARPDPKPRARLRLSSRDYGDLVFRFLMAHRTCELCGKRPSDSFHHVVSRGQGGDDVEANGAALCGDGVRRCHGRVEHSAAARSELRYGLRTESVVYAIERKGLGWFDSRYPPASA